MNTFLFLYPIKLYFSNLKNMYDLILHKIEYDTNRINEIIDARYRQRNYRVVWLTFCSEDNTGEPDLSIMSKDIKIFEQDVIIASDISLNSFHDPVKSKYPDSTSILKQIPDTTNLVLGGFHQWDCIDDIAKYAHNQGIHVIVDEDTTETFFLRATKYGTIPLIRETPFQLEDRTCADMINIQLLSRPWFLPI